MQITKIHYYCDYCGKELENKEHICIYVCHFASWVKPPNWKHKSKLENRPYQFCDEKCLITFLKTNSKKRGRPNKI